MKPTQQLHDLGQSLWLDNITCGPLTEGKVLAEFARIGIDAAALAGQLQREGTEAFDRSWRDLLGGIAAKSATLDKVEPSRGGQS